MSQNDLLDKAIEDDLAALKYDKEANEEHKKPLFYVLIVLLVTVSVLLSLCRYLVS